MPQDTRVKLNSKTQTRLIGARELLRLPDNANYAHVIDGLLDFLDRDCYRKVLIKAGWHRTSIDGQEEEWRAPGGSRSYPLRAAFEKQTYFQGLDEEGDE